MTANQPSRDGDGWPLGPFKGLGPCPLRAWALGLVSPPWAVAGPPWNPAGRALERRHLVGPLGPCGPGPCGPPGPLWVRPLRAGPLLAPWALVGREPPGPLWAWPLRLSQGPCGLGPCGPGPCGSPGPFRALLGRAFGGQALVGPLSPHGPGP